MSNSTAPALTPKGRATRKAFEDAARQLFADNGYLRTTVADITQACGRSTAAFYRYFVDKEDLLLSLAETLAEQVFSLASTDRSTGTDRYAYYEAAARAYWKVYRENAGVYVGVFQLAMVDDRARTVWLQLREEGINSIERTLTHAARDGFGPVANPRVSAEALSSMFEHSCFVWLGSGGQPRDESEAVAALAEVWFRACCYPA